MGGSSGAAGTGETKNGWSAIAERGSLLGIRITAWSYRRLGRSLTLPLVYAIVTYFFLTDAPGRRASIAYLRRIHAHAGGRGLFRRRPGIRESWVHYRTFAVAIVDRFAIWFGDGREFTFEEHGVDVFDRGTKGKGGALILGAHLGNFDALRYYALQTRNTVNVVMFTDNATRINRIFRELAPEMEQRMIAVDPNSVQSVFAIRERLRRGEHVAILADRIEVGDRDRTVPIAFLGGVVAFPQAQVILAGLLGCPVFVIVALRRGSGRYELFLEPVTERVVLPRRDRDAAVASVVERYAASLERFCLMEPYQWFNFFDYWGDAARERRRST
jgi:predicted LPLAT superfamily acyltransferase